MKNNENWSDNIVDEEENSMRDSIEAAIVTLGDESGMEPAAQPQHNEVIDAKSETAETQAASETAEGATSREAAQAKLIDGKSPADGASDGTGDIAASGSDADEQSAGSIEKAPETWQPAAREGWADLPESIRTQIHKREGEINQALMDGSENRKQGEKFNNITTKFASIIAAEGVTDPIHGFEQMMNTMAQLRMGTPEQKAMKIVQFINGYGISVEILDGLLSGQPSAPQDKNIAYIDQKLAPVNDLLGKLNQQERDGNLQRNQAFLKEVQDFKAANEFYADVKNDMADLVEQSANRGYHMPLEEAYSKACALNTEVSKILGDRASADALATGGKTLLAKRNAGSSLMAGQQQGMPATEDMSLRDTISAAMDAQTG
jgi:hypothetical protein